MTGTTNCDARSAPFVRELMQRSGLDEHSAARTLRIDEAAMRGYASGEPVPTRFVFALMLLADIGPPIRAEGAAPGDAAGHQPWRPDAHPRTSTKQAKRLRA